MTDRSTPTIPPAHRLVSGLAWRGSVTRPRDRAIPEETPTAFSYNRLGFAVMMATPADLEDFAIGFSLAETVVARPGEIEDLQVVPAEAGVELRMWINDAAMARLTARQRRITGPTGCGLCGLETLSAALRPPPAVTAEPRFGAAELGRAVSDLAGHQTLNAQTRAVHAAAFWRPGSGIVVVREDVGRHNALDKLAGAVARAGIAPEEGAVLMTSRVSVELVQKVALMGASVLLAVSAPTALALRVAEAANLTVAAVARDDGFEVLTAPRRILFGGAA